MINICLDHILNIGYAVMPEYRRIHMPAGLHEQVKQFVEEGGSYQSVDQLCREAAKAIIQEHHLTGKAGRGGEKEWRSANIPAEHYEKIQAWIKTGKTPFVSVDEAVRDAVRSILRRNVRRKRDRYT